MRAVFKDWKTTFVGVAVLGITIALLIGKIDLQQYLVAFGLLTGGGFLAAKDGSQVTSPTVVTTEVTDGGGVKTTAVTKTETGA